MAADIDKIDRINKQRTRKESELVELGFKHVEGSNGQNMSNGKEVYYFVREAEGVRMYRPPYQQT